MSDHPSYARPTIREALCEIHFALPEDAVWDPAVFGRFYRRIQNDFPEMEPATEAALRLQLQPGKIEFMPGQIRMRYRHQSRNLLLQLAAGILTINELPDYSGWKTMKEDIRQAWAWAEEIIRPVGVSRIGLRYINFVRRSDPSEQPIQWFLPNEYVARIAMDSLSGVSSRLEVRTDANSRSIVTMSEANEDESSYFVVDIDCIAEGLDGTSPIDGIIEMLHDRVWGIFASFVSPRLQRLLEGDEA